MIFFSNAFTLQVAEFVEIQGFPPMNLPLPLDGLKLLVIRGGPQPRIEVVTCHQFNMFYIPASAKLHFRLSSTCIGVQQIQKDFLLSEMEVLGQRAIVGFCFQAPKWSHLKKSWAKS